LTELNQFNIGSKTARGYEVTEFVDELREMINYAYDQIDLV
jgi:hypothetical protein